MVWPGREALHRRHGCCGRRLLWPLPDASVAATSVADTPIAVAAEQRRILHQGRLSQRLRVLPEGERLRPHLPRRGQAVRRLQAFGLYRPHTDPPEPPEPPWALAALGWV